MNRLRRLGAILFLPLCFQLGLAARAIACLDDHSGAADTTMTDGSMPGMPGMDMPASAPASNGSDTHGKQPCDGPVSSTNCQPLAACAAGALAPSGLRMVDQPDVPSDVGPLVVLTPASWTVRPELPPPRA